MLGDDLDERDVDASVRALRPRSSRRGSWESEVSKWSARIRVATPSLVRDRSLWTANSVKNGGRSVPISNMKSQRRWIPRLKNRWSSRRIRHRL